MKLIETKKLTKKYGKQTAIDQLDLTIYSGQLTAYLGTNGAGKTTTIRMLTKTLTANSGQIHYQQQLSIGVVFQTSVLDDELTVIDNLLLRGKMYKEIDKKNITDLLNRMGISSFKKKRYGKLSGGMRRKVDIARALINRPDVLFLDEPTTGLDPQSREEIWQLLTQLKQEGLGIFLTTHYLEEAEFADYVYILEKGSVLEEGTAYELKEKYNEPTLKLISNRLVDLKKHLNDYTVVQKTTDSIEVTVADKKEILPLLIKVDELITDFSYQPIGMNDVFLKVTGRRIHS